MKPLLRLVSAQAGHNKKDSEDQSSVGVVGSPPPLSLGVFFQSSEVESLNLLYSHVEFYSPATRTLNQLAFLARAVSILTPLVCPALVSSVVERKPDTYSTP